MKIDSILKEVLNRIDPPEEDLKLIKSSLDSTLDILKKNIKKEKIKAEIFIGGSFAKGTVIKKNYYDVDVFVRFDKKYKKEDISKLIKKVVKGMKNISLVHGSRDYLRIQTGPSFFIELIPVLKVKNPKESENITDLSYSHVNYIKKKIKSENILDDIRIAKAFCHANNCYGAESYINGFSGYALELLVYYYKGFLKFVKAMAKIKEKEIIDIERHHIRKKDILLDLNAAKLGSPIILIDPTYKQRNALAALSKETFEKFQKACKKFLKNPSIKDFEIKEIDFDKIKKNSSKKKLEFGLLEIKTDKQKGDVAGTKLLKFFKHLEVQIAKFFDIRNKGFEYGGEKSAKGYFVVKSKKEILVNGPFVKDKKNVSVFKRKHKKTFVKKGKIYARDKVNIDLKKFISDWKKNNKKRMKEMSIASLKVLP